MKNKRQPIKTPPLLTSVLILDVIHATIPSRFILRDSQAFSPTVLRSYIDPNSNALEIAAQLMRFALKCTRHYKTREIFVTEEARKIVHLPEYLTPEFFAKKKAE